MKKLTISSPLYRPEKTSMLVTEENWQQASIDQENFHASLGDITLESLLNFCDHVDQIEFINFGFESMTQTLETTYHVLNSLSHKFDIIGYDKQTPHSYLTHDMIRPDADSVIWVFGCSFSHGFGVDPDKTYSHYLQQHLGLPVVLVTEPGSSLKWSLRHLMHADLRPNDIVIWQITTFYRDSIKELHDLIPVEVVYTDKNLYKAKLLSFDQMIFTHLSLIDYGVQYLRAKKAKFYLISTESQSYFDYHQQLVKEYTKYPEYCYIPELMTDVAQDDLHPGPRSHKKVSEFLLKKIKND